MSRAFARHARLARARVLRPSPRARPSLLGVVRRVFHSRPPRRGVVIAFHPLQKLQIIQRPSLDQLLHLHVLRHVHSLKHQLQHFIILHELVLALRLEVHPAHRHHVSTASAPVRGVHDLAVHRPARALLHLGQPQREQRVHPRDQFVPSHEERVVHHPGRGRHIVRTVRRLVARRGVRARAIIHAAVDDPFARRFASPWFPSIVLYTPAHCIRIETIRTNGY